MTTRERLKIKLIVIARKHKPKDYQAFKSLAEEIFDVSKNQDPELYNELDRLDAKVGGISRVLKEVWSSYQKEISEDKMLVRYQQMTKRNGRNDSRVARGNPVTYQVKEEDNYLKVYHSEYGIVAAGAITKTKGWGYGGTHDVTNIEMIESKFNHNAIRQPAMEAMAKYMIKKYGKRAKATRNNPGIQDAEVLSTKFHGRNPINSVTILESESYSTNLAQLGELVELEVMSSEDSEEVVPIEFGRDNGNMIRLCSTPDGRQLEFVGGDQFLKLEDFEDAGLQLDTGKRSVVIGPVFSISYFADKHHLQGPKQQSKGIEYIHEFSEESGNPRPVLVYDKVDKHMKLIGGSYRVEEEGIKD